MSLPEEIKLHKDNLAVDKHSTLREEWYKLPPLPQRTEKQQVNDDERHHHKVEETDDKTCRSL